MSEFSTTVPTCPRCRCVLSFANTPHSCGGWPGNSGRSPSYAQPESSVPVALAEPAPDPLRTLNMGDPRMSQRLMDGLQVARMRDLERFEFYVKTGRLGVRCSRCGYSAGGGETGSWPFRDLGEAAKWAVSHVEGCAGQ